MVKVTVVLPDERKGQVEVDPSASIDAIKRTIVNDLKLGKPENFLLSIASLEEETPIGSLRLKDGDVIIVISLQAVRGAPVKGLDPSQFTK